MLAKLPEYVSPEKTSGLMAKPSEPNRSRTYQPSEPHITEFPITKANWYKHINWLNVTLIVGVPLYGCIQAIWTTLQWKTALWAIAYYYMTGLGITAGMPSTTNQLFSLAMLIFLRLPSSLHIGWMLMKQNPKGNADKLPKRIGRTDISDLNEDPVVVWQHRYYLRVVLFMGLIFPMLVCGLGWGDWLGGLIYGGILRIFFVQQATFCVNSLAHWLGDQPFDDRNSPRDHLITALITLGEGYHNFHHEFPSDYRNALEWYQYDPTKWSIWIWKQLGLAFDLKQFKQNEIEKGRLQQQQKKLDQRRSKLDWGVPIHTLPVMEWDDFQDQAKNGRDLVAIAGIVHEVTEFIKEHPGGKAMIKSGLGKDATAMFNGGIYMHSNAAHNLLSSMRVGVIRGGCEVDTWKRAHNDMRYVEDDQGQWIVRAGNQVTKISEPVWWVAAPGAAYS
ncbi:MAG: hypothetical protein Q9181_001362 [Wetmoreana brouardii]